MECGVFRQRRIFLHPAGREFFRCEEDDINEVIDDMQN
jgi:hypothetical protein